ISRPSPATTTLTTPVRMPGPEMEAVQVPSGTVSRLARCTAQVSVLLGQSQPTVLLLGTENVPAPGPVKLPVRNTPWRSGVCPERIAGGEEGRKPLEYRPPGPAYAT